MSTRMQLGRFRRLLGELGAAYQELPGLLKESSAGLCMDEGMQLVTTGLAKADVDAEAGVYDPPVNGPAPACPRTHHPDDPCRICGGVAP